MPLLQLKQNWHLLGKKSWNVYNPTSIARVRADEAAEAARVEAEEQLLDEHDAARRLAILRGVTPPASPPHIENQDGNRKRLNPEREKERNDRHREKRRRGEDDTDRDLRLAREQLEPTVEKRNSGQHHTKRKEHDMPIVDRAGHIQLFAPPEPRSGRGEKNANAEAERKKKEREYEDQYTMRFSNAAGIGHNSSRTPWYSGPEALGSGDVSEPGLNAFGRPDENRKGRDQRRLQGSDPLAAMRAGQQKLKAVEKERDAWKKERDRETRALEWDERRRRIQINKEIDDFSLDTQAKPERSYNQTESRRHHDRNGGSRRYGEHEIPGKPRISTHSHSHDQRSHREGKREDRNYSRSSRRRSRSPLR